MILNLVLVAATAFGASVAVQSSKGKVEFHAVGRPSMIKVNGEGKGPEGVLTLTSNKVAGDLTLDMTSLNTGISMRDSHMKEKYLEVGKYPTAQLHLTNVVLPEAWSAKTPAVKDGTFKADLTLHGQTKPVAGTFSIEGSSSMKLVANFEVNIAEFGIEIPKYLGITVKNEVPVELTMTDLQAK